MALRLKAVHSVVIDPKDRLFQDFCYIHNLPHLQQKPKGKNTVIEILFEIGLGQF